MSGQHRAIKAHPGFTKSLWLKPYTVVIWVSATVILGRASIIATFF